VELERCPQVVAFVPAAKTATMKTQVARSDSSFRTVETKAVLPAGHDVAALNPASSRRAVTKSAEPDGAREREIASTSETPREVLLEAGMPDSDATGQNTSPGIAGEPQYVVLTTWEEVRTSHCHHRMISDYDSDANAQPQSADAADSRGGQVVTRIIVTRLIFAVYPESSAPDTKPAHAEDSGRTSAPLPESGWLVFKL